MSDSKPNINVTPLIDILLVLLIIFMVISPLKPYSFKAKIPAESNIPGNPNPNALIVTINADSTLALNRETDLGVISAPQKMIEKLNETFRARESNGIFREGTNEIEKTVFIKAPRSFSYGEIAKIIDAVKTAGANPIGLQIDDLN